MRELLRNRGFLALAGSQFFGAVNDNILKQLLTFMVIAGGLWEGRLGEGGQGIVGLAFTLPFILLSAVAGQCADRWSKRTLTIVVRASELPIAAVAAWGFFTGNLWVAFTALVLITCQSAFFGPPKYGMIPELVRPDEIARANGAINMFTNVAVIVGIVLGGKVADAYVTDAAAAGTAGEAAAQAVGIAAPALPGIVLGVVAVGGLVLAWFLPPLTAGSPGLPIRPNPFSGYVQAIRDMARGPLLAVALAWGSFYLIAGMSLLILPEYATLLPNGSRWQASQLMGILGIAIGVGSLIAGLASGHRIKVGLVPIGAVGLTASLVGLGLFSRTFAGAAAMLTVAGFFAGFYIIPLQALLQHLAPSDERGRFVGAANAINFAFLGVAAALYKAIRAPFGNEPDRIFLVSAVLMLAATVVFTWWLGRHRAAFIAAGVGVPRQRGERRDGGRR
ncbi:MAG: MFS transporter [Planctomycetota bacterium]|jgi:acyl-[acyl-carrier-protein]-phospholipid O-acyltransferase/long-chain-fatty-acid--[acyl-carrier-protein] ligase